MAAHVPKHAAEARLMLVIIQCMHLVAIINGDRQGCVQRWLVSATQRDRLHRPGDLSNKLCSRTVL
jgi:hypothetical protein